jgi:hypothetical protein
VLLIEPNRFHAELLPGYTCYFQALGFDVEILCRRANAESGVFARVPLNRRPKCHVMHPFGMKCVAKGLSKASYDYVMITSSYLAERHGFWGPVHDYFGGIPSGRHGHAVVAHSLPQMLPFVRAGAIDARDLILLSSHRDGTMLWPMVNPHYFGVVEQKKAPAERRVFVTVGSLLGANRGIDALFEAVAFLRDSGVENFEVRIIGRQAATRAAFPNAPECIKFLGMLDYPAMYDEIESADFYLPLLDPSNAGHRRYLAGETTGSRQLVLGFLKIPVINQEFGAVYGFTERNSLLYSGTNLGPAMRSACLMTAEEYRRRIEALALLEDEVSRESIAAMADRVGIAPAA